jgi:hypothetical protein
MCVSLSGATDLDSFLRFISPTTTTSPDSCHHTIKIHHSFRTSVRPSAHLSYCRQSINHAIYRTEDCVHRCPHVRSCADHRHATTATNIIRHHSPKMNTGAFIALQAVD